ncbi:hypothetical protein BDV35DRAFT_364615 [Aspergillus flavus]|uniref:Uncharacterized protein n=1 Tax=Aspergillus flavus TaxID=5059 RepID=A0A5N6GM72_ASPFL|nr:hypothetical protein BDV35DRAFT_364615 [Aspergillus flavus]
MRSQRGSKITPELPYSSFHHQQCQTKIGTHQIHNDRDQTPSGLLSLASAAISFFVPFFRYLST